MSDRTASAVTTKAATPPPPPSWRDLSIQGRLDGTSVLQLREEVMQTVADGPVRVLVDISGVTQVTASGLAGLLELLRLARSRGGDLRLYGVSLAIADAQQASQLTAITRVYVHRDQAVAATMAQPSLANPDRSRRSAFRSSATKAAQQESNKSSVPVPAGTPVQESAPVVGGVQR